MSGRHAKSPVAFSAALFLMCFLSSPPARSSPGLPLHEIRLPPGFSISIYADNVPGARSLSLSPKGTLFVGTRDEGKVYAVIDRNGDSRADEVRYEVFAEGWLRDGTAWGRPADVLIMPDGALLVSDDKAGVIYRISYGK